MAPGARCVWEEEVVAGGPHLCVQNTIHIQTYTKAQLEHFSHELLQDLL